MKINGFEMLPCSVACVVKDKMQQKLKENLATVISWWRTDLTDGAIQNQYNLRNTCDFEVFPYSPVIVAQDATANETKEYV